MPITSGWRDTVDNIIWPTDYGRWDDLGNGSGSHFTITAIDTTNNFTFDETNNGYIRINYTDALRLTNRSEWRIDTTITINSSSTSTTNFQTAHEGVIFASGEGGLLTDDGSTRTVDYAGTIDANRKFKFYYHDGSSLNSITSTATIGVDDAIAIAVVYENSEIKIYVAGVLDSTTSASAGVRNTSNNFVIGGNTTGDSTGDYLLGCNITRFKIRKDADASTTDKQLIDFDPRSYYADYNVLNSNSEWDINTLISFIDVAPPKPRQLKLIPQTWGNWTYWWINPKSQIEVTTGSISFDQPITGFKNLDITTTDGFLCAYGQGSQDRLGGSTQYAAWKADERASGIHSLITDLNPITELKDDGPFGSGLITTQSTNYSLTLPSAGYLPTEQITESATMLDATKVDTYSGNSANNQGMRPRGILQIAYTIDQQLLAEELETNDNSERRFFMGLPYYEVSDNSSTVYEGGIYSFKRNSQTGQRFDHDFRLGNSNTIMIESIDDNSSAGAGVILTTRTAHGLSDGDKIMVRPGLFRNPGSYPNTGTGTIGNVDAFDSHRLHGISHVRVRSTTEIELFADSGLTNPVNTSTSSTLSLHTPGYIITPNASGEPYIKDLGHKLVNFTTPFADIKEIKANEEVVYRPAIERTGALAFSGGSASSFGLPSTRQAEQTVKEYFGTQSDSIQTKTTPRGNVSDPIEITTYRTGTIGSNIQGAPIFVDLDLPTDGTLYVNISEIERADSSTETPPRIIAYYGLNGHSPSAGTDDSLTSLGLDSADTVSFAISADSVMATDELRSIQLYAAIDGVTHTSGSDVTRAKWKIWFVSAVSEADNRIFWAGGMPPGFNRLTTGARNTASSSTNYISRERSSIVFKTPSENSTFTVFGIPLVAHSLLGETYISSGNAFEIFRIEGSGNAKHYDLNKVDETITKTNGGVSSQGPDIAPWVRFATQTKDQYRLHNRRRWRCLETHTSSKEFVTDLQLGRWEVV
jgi:hypothetical protein